jgi:hypothetical protein
VQINPLGKSGQAAICAHLNRRELRGIKRADAHFRSRFTRGSQSADEDGVTRQKHIAPTLRITPHLARENDAVQNARVQLVASAAEEETRQSRIEQLRRTVAADSYDCEMKLSIAMDRMMEKVLEVK